MKPKKIKKVKQALVAEIDKKLFAEVNKERTTTWPSLLEMLLSGWLEDRKLLKEPIERIKNKIKKYSCKNCGTAKGLKMHSCPFKSEIHGDETKCNCCEACQHECAMDI